MNNENIKNFLENVQTKTISLYRYSIKRAFGIYYSTWAIALFYFIFFSPLLIAYLPNNIEGDLLDDLGFTAVILAATYFTFKAFSRSSRSKELESIFHMKYKNRLGIFFRWFNIVFMAVLFGYLFIAIYLVNVLPVFVFYVVFYLFLLFISFVLLFSLKVSLGRIPFEGYLASLTYMFSSLSSIFLFLLIHPTIFPIASIQIIWAPTVISWVIAGMYTFYTAPGELGFYEP